MENLNYENEIWKDVKGYEGCYRVSNKGQVWSLLSNRLIKSFSNGKTTHRAVHLRLNGVEKKEYVHRLVAFAFPEICGEWFEGAECNHKDENPENNCAWNLEWVTHKYNNSYGLKGENHSKIMSKEPVLQIKNGIIIKEWRSAEKAGKELGLVSHSIRNCCKHKYGFKSCGGFNWEFKNNLKKLKK